MNINNGKTGTVNIPGALHSTGGDGDGLVGNVVAYAGDVYDENLNANQAEINKSTIKLNEYNKVNVSYPTSEQMEGSILCNLVKNDEKILQDHSAWGSEFADYVRNHNVYIGTNFGNAGIEEEDFTGYIRGEEIVNVMNSDDKSTIVECFSSASDYWIVETESELIAEDNLYASTGTYTQRYITTPFSLQEDGNLFIKGVGGFDGTNSQSASTKSLQDVLNEIASGGVSSWNDLEDKPTILDSYDIRQIVLDKCPLHYDDSRSNYISYVPNGSNDSYTLNTVRNTYNGIVLGKYNSQDGKNNSYSDACTVVLGTSNTNDSKNSLLIGAINNNNQDNSVMLGRSNINKSEGGINIGYYNQNNGGERNVMIGYDNTSSNSASTICLGSENRFSMSYYDPSSQDIIAVGRGLYCSASGIVMGFYNVQDSVLEGDTANFLTIGDGSGNIYSSTRSNIIEQRRNGDIYIKGIGNYNGNNSRRNVQDPTRGKSLQEVLSQLTTDIQSVSANTGGGSGSSSGGSVSVTSDEDWVNEVLPGAILVSGVTITAKWITDTMRGNYVYLGFEADREVNWDLFNIDVYDWNTEHHYNRNKNDYTRIVDGCLMTELNQLSTLSGNTEAISTQEIAIEGKPSFGYSYTIECDENLLNQMYDHDGYWWIDNLGNNISY